MHEPVHRGHMPYPRVLVSEAAMGETIGSHLYHATDGTLLIIVVSFFDDSLDTVAVSCLVRTASRHSHNETWVTSNCTTETLRRSSAVTTSETSFHGFGALDVQGLEKTTASKMYVSPYKNGWLNPNPLQHPYTA